LDRGIGSGPHVGVAEVCACPCVHPQAQAGQAQAPEREVGAGDQGSTLEIGTGPEEEAAGPTVAVDEESVRSLESPGRPHHHIGKEHTVRPYAAIGSSLSSGIEPKAVALRLEAGREETSTEYSDESNPQSTAHDSRPDSFRCLR